MRRDPDLMILAEIFCCEQAVEEKVLKCAKRIAAYFLNGEEATRVKEKKSAATEEDWLSYAHPEKERVEIEMATLLREMVARIFAVALETNTAIRALKGEPKS